MTYYINDVSLANAYITKRTSADAWQLISKAAERIPRIEQSAMKPTVFNLQMLLEGSTRYTLANSIRNGIHLCDKVLVYEDGSKYLYGSAQQVWLAQTKLLIREAGSKQLKVTLTGNIDPYQIHSCDFETYWSSVLFTQSLGNAFEGKYSLKGTASSPSATQNYYLYYVAPTTMDLSGDNYVTFMIYSDRASTAYTASKILLWQATGHYFTFNITYDASKWKAIAIDLANPDSTGGSPSLSTINRIYLQVTAADSTTFYHQIDNFQIR